MNSFAYWAKHLEGSRNGYDRPIANNTRVHWCGEDVIEIKLHSTNIIRFHRDGRVQLNSGGWETVTTQERIHRYTNARVFAVREKGETESVWYMHLTPNPNDPRPEYPHRNIPKPFVVDDPGPEPVKSTVWCHAGLEQIETVTRQVFLKRDEMREGEVVAREARSSLGDYVYVEREITLATRWIEATTSYWDLREQKSNPDTDETVHRVCPHCEHFVKVHREWDKQMNGGWASCKRGYAQMCENLELYGSFENWHEAYITEFREVRAAHKLYRQWENRNTKRFFDGIFIDSDGYPCEESNVVQFPVRRAA